MKMIASREMAAKPAAVWKSLKDEGAVVVTKNGQPEGVFFATSSETWLEDIQDVLFARARRAASAMRQSAAQSGTAALSDAEIEAEILAVRAKRKR
jgi:hypothetical protein